MSRDRNPKDSFSLADRPIDNKEPSCAAGQSSRRLSFMAESALGTRLELRMRVFPGPRTRSTLSMKHLVDLTQTLRAGMRGVAWDTATTVEREGWNARALHLYSHAGTHMDAQAHFAAGPETIDQIPLERCMGPAWRSE